MVSQRLLPTGACRACVHSVRTVLREGLLNEKRLHEERSFDPALIRHMWAEHVPGAPQEHQYLWDVLVFQAWLQYQSRVQKAVEAAIH